MNPQTDIKTGLVYKLVRPHSRKCPHAINPNPGAKPWRFIGVLDRDRLGRRNGNACGWLLFACCCKCGASMMVRATTVAEMLPAMVEVKR